MSATTVAECLIEWKAEARRPVLRDTHEVVIKELAGYIVDLCDGSAFVQHDEWHDFAYRWMAEQLRRRQWPTVENLAQAINKANHHRFSHQLCYDMAKVLMPLALIPPRPLMPQDRTASSGGGGNVKKHSAQPA